VTGSHRRPPSQKAPRYDLPLGPDCLLNGGRGLQFSVLGVSDGHSPLSLLPLRCRWVGGSEQGGPAAVLRRRPHPRRQQVVRWFRPPESIKIFLHKKCLVCSSSPKHQIVTCGGALFHPWGGGYAGRIPRIFPNHLHDPFSRLISGFFSPTVINHIVLFCSEKTGGIGMIFNTIKFPKFQKNLKQVKHQSIHYAIIFFVLIVSKIYIIYNNI